MLIQIATVLLVDRSGSLLMQLRDEHAPNWPGVWGVPGGHVEPGESVLDAAVRELWEETSLLADGPLELFARQELPEHSVEKTYFFGSTAAAQEDVIVGEGAAIVFTRPAELFDGRPYTPGTEEILARFLASPSYADLAGITP